MRHYLVAFLAVAVLMAPAFMAGFPRESEAFVAAMNKFGASLEAAVGIIHDPVTVDQLKTDYATATQSAMSGSNQKVRILIVPGHEPDYGGAEGYGLKERDLTVELGKYLADFLRGDSHYAVFITRDQHDWTPEFSNYFKAEKDQITEWMNAHVSEQRALQKVGEYTRVAPAVTHTKAQPGVVNRLFGINKWVNENNIDIVVHVHFNDYPGHGGSAGDYSGFTIYVPQKQFYNSTTTKAVADNVYRRLAKYNPVSNLKGEDGGIVEDQDLIAVGAYNSVDAASMLIEYAYLYEPRLQDPSIRHATLREMAFETYLGIMDFFDPSAAAAATNLYDTRVLPHRWEKEITADNADGQPFEVFALQTALILDGDYPPAGKGMNDCPRSGGFGSCTKSSLAAFQLKYHITGEKDRVGSSTMQTLNKIFGYQ